MFLPTYFVTTFVAQFLVIKQEEVFFEQYYFNVKDFEKVYAVVVFRHCVFTIYNFPFIEQFDYTNNVLFEVLFKIWVIV